VAAKPSAADGSGRADVEPRNAVRAAPTPTIATVGTLQAMDEYRRRLDRTQIKLCALLTALLFIGLLILPRIGQAIWIAIIAAVYIRVTLVIARREELLEEQSPRTKVTNALLGLMHGRAASCRIPKGPGLYAMTLIPAVGRRRSLDVNSSPQLACAVRKRYTHSCAYGWRRKPERGWSMFRRCKNRPLRVIQPTPSRVACTGLAE
jgi:hypothetical protein